MVASKKTLWSMHGKAFSDSLLNLSSDKFYPPQLDPTRNLFRKTLIKTLISQAKQRQLILIEAQAGQGKSIIAAQFISRIKSSAGWYQIGPEDGDPVRLLTSIIACLKKTLPALSVPLLFDMAKKGEINAYEYPRYLDILCSGLTKCLAKDCFFVFDDLHLLEESPQSQAFLAYFITHAPNRLHFILTSRRPMPHGEALDALRQKAFIVQNDALGLSAEEIFSLYNDIWQIAITHSEAAQLWRSTEGWVMGLVLAEREIMLESENRNNIDSFDILNKASAGSLADYFRRESFARLDKKTMGILCRLSLLDTIPLALAEQITGNRQVDVILNDFADSNYFVHRLNDEGTDFAFHHLFQETLRRMADEELSASVRKKILQQAGNYYLERKNPEAALSFFSRAKDYRAIELSLRQEGMDLYAMNRVGMIESVLQDIPKSIVKEYSWLPLFAGMLRLRTIQPDALTYLMQAWVNFETQNEGTGKLLALAHLINFHAYIDNRFTQGLPLLKEAEEGFAASFDSLKPHFKIQVALSLSLGYCLFKGEMDKAGYYSSTAFRLSEDLDLDNFKGAAILSRGQENCLVGKWDGFTREIENAYALSTSPHLNNITKMLMNALSFNYYGVNGIPDRITQLLASMKIKLGEEIIRKSAFEPFCILFEADSQVGMGFTDKALDLIQHGLNFGWAAASPHMRSQYLQYRAYIASLSGDARTALAAAEESLALREETGGKVFVTLNEMIIGGTYARLGLRDEAEAILEKAMTHSKELEERFMRVGAHAHRASLRWRSGDKASALTDLRECLQGMAKNGYRHFFSWTPSLMQPLLECAVVNGIEPAYAQQLAQERLGIAILPDGTFIQLMKIQTFSTLNISLESQTVSSDNLTPTMRELLALVISAPSMKISQEEIMANLWPDISVAKARGRFDTLLMELRKILKATFAGINLDHYLVLRKGYLCLQNCQLDAELFTTLARRGLTHNLRKEFWQAGNSFYSASQLWKGPYLLGMRGKDLVSSKAYELDRLYSDISLVWAEILLEAGQFVDCIEVLNRALGHDRTNDALVKALYQTYVRSKQPVRANELLKQYETALHTAEYDPEEIAEALKEVWLVCQI